LVTNGLQGIRVGVLSAAPPVQSRKVEADGATGDGLENLVKHPTHEAKGENRVLVALCDALLEYLLDELAGETVHALQR
jgi:hypothetical protein